MKKIIFWFILLILLIGGIFFGVKKYISNKEIYENSNFVTLNRNGTINRVEIPIENNSFISDELLKNLKLYDSNDKLIGEFEKIENSIYVKLLVKIKPNKFFNREMIMRDVNNPNRVFIYPEGLGLGKGMIVRNITKNGNVDTEIKGNIIRTKLLSGRVIEEEKFEDKHTVKYYNEKGELEKEEEYVPAYIRLKKDKEELEAKIKKLNESSENYFF